MTTSTLTRKHQTTVPRQIREQLRLEPGEVLRWEVRDGEARVRPSRGDFLAWKGKIRAGRGSIVADVRAARELRGRAKW